MEQKSAEQMREHKLWTYYGLRVGLVAIGFFLPVLVVSAGWFHVSDWRGSLSDYYNIVTTGILTPRDIFVGGLLAAAACLYLYKGYSDAENNVLNVAGIAAAIVAFFPTGPEGPVTYIHRTAAVVFFLCIAYVCLFLAQETLNDDLLSKEKQEVFRKRYKRIGGLMLASPIAALLLSWAFGTAEKSVSVLLIEWFGVWVFAGYWGVKTLEMRQSEAEKKALEGALKRTNKTVRAA
jgi:hypothetical protein